MKNKRTILRFIVLAVIFVALGAAFYTAYTSEGPVEIGKPVPNFTLETLDGDTVSVSDYKGKGLLINFWATWCGPCREEMPLMNEYYQKYDDEFEILAVNIAESDLAVSTFVRRYDLSFPILLDSDKSVTNQYGVGQLPSTYVVDAEGTLLAVHDQILTEELLDSYLEMILGNEE